MSKPAPIRVFYSDLGKHGRFWATQHYREETAPSGATMYVITGEKYDVTQDIAEAIVKHDVEFVPADETQEQITND